MTRETRLLTVGGCVGVVIKLGKTQGEHDVADDEGRVQDDSHEEGSVEGLERG